MLGFSGLSRASPVGLLTDVFEQGFAFSVLDGQLLQTQGMLSNL